MSQRRILIIGSQCEMLNDLDFLPETAQTLYKTMTDPERGACVSALEDIGLLINPTVKETKDALKKAYEYAAQDEATLFIAYIGHGERIDEDFYLLPWDAKNPPVSDTAVHLINLITEFHRTVKGHVDGLGVLIDACYSGVAGFGAAEAWVNGLKGTLRFEVLTAAADRPAANGCFSRTLAGLLDQGISEEPSAHLHCFHLRPRLEMSCPNQVPQHPAYNPDKTLWLAKNAGRTLEPWAQMPLSDEIQRLTLAYQPTPALVELVGRSHVERCVAVVGEAGIGKSALSAALALPKVTSGIVPAQFTHAIALLNEATTPQELASILTKQLKRSVDGFSEAQQAFARETPFAEQQKLGALDKQLVGPLRRLKRPTEIRLVVDALNRLTTGAQGSVMDALEQLNDITIVYLVITARPDTELPSAASTFTLASAPEENVHQYLMQRGVPPSRQGEVVQAARGNWLVVRVLADLLCEQSEAAIGTGLLTLGDAYDEMLLRCDATENGDTQAVLAILAAAGAGPLLPLSLLCKASEELGGPKTPALVRDQLVQLRGLAVRSAAGTDDEHAGLFHQTFAEHIAARDPEANRQAHGALVAGIQTLTPPGSKSADLNNPLERYAFEREAEHLWVLEEINKVLESLRNRESPVPQDNLRRWMRWAPRSEGQLGFNYLQTLSTCHYIATWTGQCGDARKALQLFQVLLPDQERVLGPDHPGTLNTRSNIATWTGECGNARKALQIFQALLPDQERVLGPDHPDTLTTRHNIAAWSSKCGDASEALQLFQALLPDRERVLGPDHRATLTTRSNIAGCIGECGDARKALQLFQALLPDQERVLGPNHPDTLTTRLNIASCIGRCGDARKALQLFQALLPDQERVLGPDHPETLSTRHDIAGWTGVYSDDRKALQLFQALLPDQERVLGPNHPDTLTTRHNIAAWTSKCGDASEALQLFQALLPDRERVLGPDHPETLSTRGWIDHLSKT